MKTNKELLKALIIFKETFSTEIIDVINYENDWWLVYEWLDNIKEKWSKPKRILKLNSFRYQKEDSGNPFDFLVNDPISISFFYDPIQTLPSTVVAIDNPDIKVPLLIE